MPYKSYLTYTGKSVCIYSYNSRGFGPEKQDICKILMSNSGESFSILCNQENFLLAGNGYKIKQCLMQIEDNKTRCGCLLLQQTDPFF